jgi:methionyl-tRNA formyltransferase
VRVGFAGTPAFAALALAAIAEAGFTIPLVLTQPDRPKGRGLQTTSSPVKAWAQANAIPVFQPASLKHDADRSALLAMPLDVLVVAAYGLILPGAILRWPRHGCLNIHASHLPRWRGAAPIQRAIEAGDAATGVTIMKMDEGLDTGPTIAFHDVAIADDDTAATLTERLARTGAAAIVNALRALARDGALVATPQPQAGATYAAKVGRRDAAIDWHAPARSVERKVRAYDPDPGAFATFDGVEVKVRIARAIARDAAAVEPGTVLASSSAGIDVACGDGALRLVALQPAGGRRMDAAAFSAGRRISPGARFANGRA